MSEEMRAFLKGGLPALLIGIAFLVGVIVVAGKLADKLIAATHV